MPRPARAGNGRLRSAVAGARGGGIVRPMIALALACALAGAVLDAPGPAQKVLVLDLVPTGVDADDARALDALVLAEASRIVGLDVVAADEIRRLAALEADKQQMGCDDESCLGELAGALGARFVVFGTVSKLGDATTLTLSLYDGAGETRLRREAATAKTAAKLAPSVRPTVQKLMRQVGVDVVVEEPAPTPTSPLVWIGAAGLGAGGLVALAATAVVALAEANVQTPTRDAREKADAQILGRTALVVGGVAVVVGAVGGGALALGLLE
jgi:hypothetical protein